MTGQIFGDLEELLCLRKPVLLFKLLLCARNERTKGFMLEKDEKCFSESLVQDYMAIITPIGIIIAIIITLSLLDSSTFSHHSHQMVY